MVHLENQPLAVSPIRRSQSTDEVSGYRAAVAISTYNIEFDSFQGTKELVWPSLQILDIFGTWPALQQHAISEFLYAGPSSEAGGLIISTVKWTGRSESVNDDVDVCAHANALN